MNVFLIGWDFRFFLIFGHTWVSFEGGVAGTVLIWSMLWDTVGLPSPCCQGCCWLKAHCLWNWSLDQLVKERKFRPLNNRNTSRYENNDEFLNTLHRDLRKQQFTEWRDSLQNEQKSFLTVYLTEIHSLREMQLRTSQNHAGILSSHLPVCLSFRNQIPALVSQEGKQPWYTVGETVDWCVHYANHFDYPYLYNQNISILISI